MIVNSCGQAPPTVTSLKLMIGVASQSSVAVALPVSAGSVLAVHSIVMFTGQVISGARLSPGAVMIWIHIEVFPQSSVADHVLKIVLSMGQIASCTISTKEIVDPSSQLSVAVAIPV